MLSKIKTIILSMAALAAFSAPVLVPVTAHAATVDIKNSVCTGANEFNLADTNASTHCESLNGSATNFNNLLKKIINIFSVIVGVVAVIMIIVGGFRYITSGGQAEKVTGAKNTILYALIGLVIVALAQIIVKFVLNKAAGA